MEIWIQEITSTHTHLFLEQVDRVSGVGAGCGDAGWWRSQDGGYNLTLALEGAPHHVVAGEPHLGTPLERTHRHLHVLQLLQ